MRLMVYERNEGAIANKQLVSDGRLQEKEQMNRGQRLQLLENKGAAVQRSGNFWLASGTRGQKSIHSYIHI